MNAALSVRQILSGFILLASLLVPLVTQAAFSSHIRLLYPPKQRKPVLTKASRPSIKRPSAVSQVKSVEQVAPPVKIYSFTEEELKALVALQVETLLKDKVLALSAPVPALTFDKLQDLNRDFDPEKGLQTYYIPAQAHAEEGTFITATNIGAGKFSGGSMEVGDLTVSGDATIQGELNTTVLRLSGLPTEEGEEEEYRVIDTNTGAYLSSGGAWTNASSRDLKENFIPVDGLEILQKIDALSITRWNYKTETPSTTHIGPLAEDFYEAFQLGGKGGSKSISTIDPAGIALAAIQALSHKLAEPASWLLQGLSSVGIIIEEQVVNVGHLVTRLIKTDELEIGTGERPTGVTLYDRTTKLPYCLGVNDGAFDIQSGPCSASRSEPATVSLPAMPAAEEGSNATPAAVPAPAIVETRVDAVLNVPASTDPITAPTSSESTESTDILPIEEQVLSSPTAEPVSTPEIPPPTVSYPSDLE